VELSRGDLVRAAGGPDRDRADRLATVEKDIRQAQAEALGRTGERLQLILDRLAELDRRLDALLAAVGETQDDPGRSDLARSEMDARNRLRDDAARVRHHLIIQREALGLPRHAPVEQCYPVPARRRVPVSPPERGRMP
jgi:hypothetical protein